MTEVGNTIFEEAILRLEREKRTESLTTKLSKESIERLEEIAKGCDMSKEDTIVAIINYCYSYFK